MTTTPIIHIPASAHPWSIVYATAKTIDPDSWLLTGGLMVQLHAMMGGLDVRPTTDADLLADLMSDRRGINEIRNVLSRYGFTARTGTLTGYATRLVAPNGNVVDLLVADHLPKHLHGDAKLSGSPILPMPGGAQAIERSMHVTIADHGESVLIRIPDLLGALILKSAAWSADRAGFESRHLRDAAMLASLIDDPDAEVSRLHSTTDRRRLRVLRDQLTEDSEYWDGLDDRHRRNGLDTIETLAAW